MCVCSVGTYLDCSSSDRFDLDVFLLNACDTLGGYTKDSGKCCYFQNFEFARDLFAAFCSVLIRMYLNYTVECFSGFLSRVSLSDEQKIIQNILKHAYIFLIKFWDETNLSSFMNFLIYLIRLILVCVIKMFIQNLSLAHIMALVIPSQLFTFKSIWF